MCSPLSFNHFVQKAQKIFSKVGEAARLTTPKGSAVFTIRLNSEVEGNGFGSILMNDSIKVSKLLVAQKNGIVYCSKFAGHLHYACIINDYFIVMLIAIMELFIYIYYIQYIAFIFISTCRLL